VTAIVTSPAALTPRDVDPVTLPSVAEIVVVPAAMLLANPVLFIVAIAGAEELQVTEFVRFCWVPLLKVPVATNCCVPPNVTAGFEGDTASETTADPTVSEVELERTPSAALIVVLPAVKADATPFASAVLVIVAMPVLDELQLADCVTS
jgi:hypothetical protein